LFINSCSAGGVAVAAEKLPAHGGAMELTSLEEQVQ
jgi:hypothetical protein